MSMMVLLSFNNKSQVLQDQFLKNLKKDYCYPTDDLHKSMYLLKINAIAEQDVYNYFIDNLQITCKSSSMKKRNDHNLL